MRKVKRFRVVWTEDLVKEIEIEADSADDAKEAVFSGEYEEDDVRLLDSDYGLVEAKEIKN